MKSFLSRFGSLVLFVLSGFDRLRLAGESRLLNHARGVESYLWQRQIPFKEFPDHAEHLTYAGPDSLPIHARPLALKRAIVNLVQNALNYGGLARVSLAPARNGLVTLLVDDNGPGIADARLEDVFQAFLRLEPSRNRETGGTGLGLTIARNILRAHGGDVKLENRPSGGLRVVVTLPV